MRRKLWFLSLLIVLLAGGAGLYFHLTKGSTPSKTARGPAPGTPPGNPSGAPPQAGKVDRVPVRTAAVVKQDLEVTLPVFGAITYLEKVDVGAEMAGVLKEVPVQTGDLVQPGQVVAVLDTDLLQAELQAKTALLAQARAQLQLATWHYQAQKKVYKVGGISLKDMEEAEAAYHGRQAESARYKAEIAQVKTQIRKATLTSPIVGVVGLKNFNKGERIHSQMEKGIVTLMQVDEVYAEAEVNERDLPRLRPGLEAVVFPDAYPAAPVRGKIERLEPVLKQDTRSVIAKIRLPNPQLLLRPGMFARIEIVLDKIADALAVPMAALRQAPDKSWQVFVVDDEVAFLRKVAVGLTTPTMAEIKDGLAPGDAVVVEGAERLRDLSRVVSQPAP